MDGTYKVHERESRLARWAILGLLAGALALPCAAFAQAGAREEEESSEDLGEPAPLAGQLAPGNIPAETPSRNAPSPTGEQLPPTAPALVAPPAAPPSPFTFTLKGQVTGTVFVQDVPFGGAIGGSAIFAPANLTDDKWFLGGDVRQSRLNFSVKGPQLLSGAVPNGVVEFDLLGGNQITSVPGAPTAVPVTSMGMPVGSGTVTLPTSSAQGDESIIPRLRIAYVELTWGAGTDIIRAGQFHNLLLPMIAASATHTGTPLGYGAGQLGWRSPGITYLHREQFGEDTFLDLGVQINRNSWVDNLPTCPPGATPPMTNCLPQGVSLGEASLLPQFEGRIMLSGGKAPSPWLYYAPNVWQVYLVGHWDFKDLSGVGLKSAPGNRDSMATLVAEAGFKLHLGPVLLAANGWTGKNTGGVYGNMIQLQTPSAAIPNVKDVSGFGAWAQLGFNITEHLTAWAFGGIDKPNKNEALAAGFSRLQNLQLNFMVAWQDGPIIVAAELFMVATDIFIAANPTTMAAAATVTNRGVQPSLSMVYNF